MTLTHRGMVVAIDGTGADTILRSWVGVRTGRLARVVLRHLGERRVLSTYRQQCAALAWRVLSERAAQTGTSVNPHAGREVG